MYGADLTKWLYNQASAGSNANDQSQLMDPLSCMIRIALLHFMNEGTKISIQSNKITYQLPTLLQGANRWYNGDNRNDLHNLHHPIIIACENYNPVENREIAKIFEYTIKGLVKLKKAYTRHGESNLVAHCLNHYIDIVMDFMRPAKMGVPIPAATVGKSAAISSSASASASSSIAAASTPSPPNLSPVPLTVGGIEDIMDTTYISDIEDYTSQVDMPTVRRPRLISIHETERRQQESLHINYKGLWMAEEIHIIHELLELGEKKAEHPEKVEYILRAIENLLEEKDANIRAILVRISRTI